MTEDQPLKTRWSSPPTSSPLSGGISHSQSIPENSAGSLQGQKSTMRQSSSCFNSGQITIALWISQTSQECVGERVSTGVWEVSGPESKLALCCLRWPRPAHLRLRLSCPAHLHLRWSCPAHLRWSRPARLRLPWFRPVPRYPSAPRYPWAC